MAQLTWLVFVCLFGLSLSSSNSLVNLTQADGQYDVQGRSSCFSLPRYVKSKAPYDVGTTGVLAAAFAGFALTDYVYQPCGVVGAIGPFNCAAEGCLFAYTPGHNAEQIITGDATMSHWSAINLTDWSYGITSAFDWIPGVINNTGLCDDNLARYVRTDFTCENGDDTMSFTHYPANSTDACMFVLRVDSSVVCAYKYNTTMSSTGMGSSGASYQSSSHSFESSSTSTDSTGTSGEPNNDRVSKSEMAIVVSIVAAIAVIIGMVAGACVALYIKRRRSTPRNPYDESLL